MSAQAKHWNYSEDLVHSHLKGLCQVNPDLRLIDSERVVFASSSQKSKVMILSGGGSGHEPLHAGFVGEGLLDVAVAGFIFASPSTKQIFAGLKSKPSDKGTLIVVKNYTGDILHFGLAAEKAKAEGLNVELLIVQDDVSVGRAKNGMVGRRGLAGTSLVHKIVGAKSAKDNNAATLQEVTKLGEAVVSNLVTIGASLDHVTIPGIRHNEEESDDEEEETKHLLKEDEIEVGMGIHNESGIKRVSPIPTIDHLCSDLLKYLLDTKDKDRNYVSFEKSDEVVLMINNLGGTSVLELYAIQNTVVTLLQKEYGIAPVRIYTGAFTTSLDGPGFSITLLNATKAGGSEVLECLDYPTSVPGWNCHTTNWSSKTSDYIVEAPEIDDGLNTTSQVESSATVFKAILESGCKKLLTKEPKITLYDTVAGDGDCGETLANGAHAILKLLEEDKLALGDGVRALTQITDVVETAMGGTSGGLYSIFISALAKSLKQKEISEGAFTVSAETLAVSLNDALESLYKYTRARTGDRTLIDALAPFVETFLATKGDLNKANVACNEGAESTRKLKAKFGRASYVGEEEFKQFESEGGLPDPGAIGLAALVDGFAEAYSKIGSNL